MTNKEARDYLAGCINCTLKDKDDVCLDKECFDAKVLALKALNEAISKEKETEQ